MKRGAFILLVFFVGCEPHFQSGRTQCSDKGDCPSGFVCGRNGTSNVCFDNKLAGCPRGYVYCPQSTTCAMSFAACPAATGGSGGSAGSGGSGGSSGSCPLPEAGGTCNVFPSCGCPTGQVCYPDTQATGLQCLPSNGLGEGADCSGAGDLCAANLGCFGSVCKRYCQSDSDCVAVDSARSCLPTYWDDVNTIPGVSVCARVCDPVSPRNPRSPLLACPAGFGCYAEASSPGASNCEPQSGTGVTSSTCSTDGDCTPGYYCTIGNICMKYCHTSADCPVGSTCSPFSTPMYAGTTSVGHCSNAGADAGAPDALLSDSAVPDSRLPDTAVLDSRLPDSAVPDSRLPDTAVLTCPPPAAGGTCNVFPACGCPAGQICYPDTPATGLTCEATAGLGEGAACNGKGCASSLGCFGGVCKRYCQSDSDCPAIDTARACAQTTWSPGVDILGVLVCARVCDPVSPQSPRSPLLACPAGFGCTAGGTSLPGATDCESQSGTGITGSACSTDDDCIPGYYCSVGNTCIKYCYTVADCPTGTTCISFSTPNYAGTTQVNHCRSP